MRLDSDSATPKLTFKPIRFLERGEWQAGVAKGDTDAAKQAVTLSFTKYEEKSEAVAEAAEEEPKKRASKKSEPAPKSDLGSIMNKWISDDE